MEEDGAGAVIYLDLPRHSKGWVRWAQDLGGNQLTLSFQYFNFEQQLCNIEVHTDFEKMNSNMNNKFNYLLEAF